MERLVQRMTDQMTDEEIFDLLNEHPTLHRYLFLEWRYWTYNSARDFHKTDVTKLHVYDWVRLAKHLTPATLWNLQQAIPRLLAVKSLTDVTRAWKKANPFDCTICKVRWSSKLVSVESYSATVKRGVIVSRRKLFRCTTGV